MREMSINTQGGAPYLVLRLDQDDQLDRLAMGMIINNNISGLLSVSTRRVNQDFYLHYDISSLTPLTNAYGALANEKRLLLCLRSLCRLVSECHEYLLDESGLDLNPEHVYVQLSTSEIRVAYLPLEDEQAGTTLFEFVRSLVMAISGNFPADSKILSMLYPMVLAEEQFSLAALDERLTQMQTDGAIQSDRGSAPHAAHVKPVSAPRREVSSPIHPVVPSVQERVPEPASEPVFGREGHDVPTPAMKKLFGGKTQSEKPLKGKKPAKEKPAKPQKAGFGMNMAIPGMSTSAQEAKEQEVEIATPPAKKSAFGAFQKKTPVAAPETPRNPVPMPPATPAQQNQQPAGDGYTYYLDSEDSGIPATTALIANEASEGAVTLALVRRATGQRVRITHSNFHIGRGQGLVDFFISTSAPYIGVDHAYIMIQGEQYLFVDNNSKNHSWLNGTLLESSRPYPVQAGDQLKLADEYFDVVSD